MAQGISPELIRIQGEQPPATPIGQDQLIYKICALATSLGTNPATMIERIVQLTGRIDSCTDTVRDDTARALRIAYVQTVIARYQQVCADQLVDLQTAHVSNIAAALSGEDTPPYIG